MPNAKGWYTKEEVLETGLPYWNGRRWTDEPYELAVLLTKTRCKEFGIPILRNGHEKPSAFRYAAAAGSGTDDNKHRYYPLYDRTDVFESGEIAMDRLYPHEVMGQALESFRSAKEWIDARTNRPKPGEYLVYTIAGREIGRFGEDGKWRVKSLDSFDSPEWTIDMTITHWMDLPEEPEQDET